MSRKEAEGGSLSVVKYRAAILLERPKYLYFELSEIMMNEQVMNQRGDDPVRPNSFSILDFSQLQNGECLAST